MPGRPRERRPVHARRALDGDGDRAARQRRRGGRAVPHAQPDQPRAHAGATSSATRSSPTSSPPTSTPTRRTSAAAAGPGTPARPAGCTALGLEGILGLERRGATLSPSTPASRPRGRASRSRGASDGRATRSRSRIRIGAAAASRPRRSTGSPSPPRDPAGGRRRIHRVAWCWANRPPPPRRPR